MKLDFVLSGMGGAIAFFLCLFFGVYSAVTDAAMFEHLAVGIAVSGGFYSAYQLWETGNLKLMFFAFLYGVAMGTGGFYAAFV